MIMQPTLSDRQTEQRAGYAITARRAPTSIERA